MASKRSQRSDLPSDLKFLAQTTYATMFVSALLTFLDQMAERRKKEERRTKQSLDSPQTIEANKKVL